MFLQNYKQELKPHFSFLQQQLALQLDKVTEQSSTNCLSITQDEITSCGKLDDNNTRSDLWPTVYCM